MFGFRDLDVYYSFNSVKAGRAFKLFVCGYEPSLMGLLVRGSRGDSLFDTSNITG
jgi:hypothetical protein